MHNIYKGVSKYLEQTEDYSLNGIVIDEDTVKTASGNTVAGKKYFDAVQLTKKTEYTKDNQERTEEPFVNKNAINDNFYETYVSKYLNDKKI